MTEVPSPAPAVPQDASKSSGREAALQRLSLNRELRVGDLLTVATIAISLIGVLVSWSLDRRIRQRTEAITIRTAAAGVISQLERWKSVSQSLFPQAQPGFVEASEILADVTSKQSRAARWQEARDFLYKEVNRIHNVISMKLIDERIDTGYEGLLSYYPEVRALYRETLVRLREADAEMLLDLLRGLELAIRPFELGNQTLYSAEVGNALRDASSKIEAGYRARVDRELEKAMGFLVHKIEANDAELLERKETK